MTLRVLSLIPFLLAAIVVLFAPVLGPRRIFFAVRVQPDFRSTEAARRALRQYQLGVAAIALAGLVWIFALPQNPRAGLIPEFLLFAAAIVFWQRNYRALAKYHANPPTIASVELTTEPDRLPRFFLASMIPPIILAGTALYLFLHWSSIPAQYPIHWGPDGEPNGWATRSVRGVYGPLIFAALWMTWLVGMAFASWYGARRSPVRAAVAKIMIAMEFLFGLVWPAVSLMPLYRPNAVLLVTVILGGVAGTIAYSLVTFRRAASQAGEEVIPAASGGSSFFDRQNPAILLPRADGLGYSPNLAHPVAWLLLLCPFAIILFAIIFIF